MNQRRLDDLERRVRVLEDAARTRAQMTAPFCEIWVRDLRGEGRVALIYHPEGKAGKRESPLEMTLGEAVAWAAGREIPGHIVMNTCPLWTYAFYQRCDLYTTAQCARFREHDLETYPDVADVIGNATEDEEAEIIDFLAGIPQIIDI